MGIYTDFAEGELFFGFTGIYTGIYASKPLYIVNEATRQDLERLDQIHYDLRHQVELRKFGVEIATGVLEAEREELLGRGPGSQVTRDYCPTRLEEIRRRQDFVLHRLAESGTVIESCPSSNLRIGGVPDAARHPIHRFLRSQVNLVVGADDPGIFDSPLAAEIDWVVAHSGLDARGLAQRLGDPRRFRLGQQRPR